MKKTVISLLSMAFAATLLADTTFPMSVDFAQGAGDLNPALHGAHLIPPIKDHATQDDTDIKALGLYSVRNHDHALLDTNQRVFDLPLVYPLAQLDPTADASYIFPPTDELVNTITQTIGTDLLYRLGVSTEESGEEHFNAEIPADFDNTAAAMSHIVARYKDKVTYWEIWNNPASTAYWWKDGYSDAQRKEAFVDLFTTALAKIKTDHPTVKAGGPSIMLPDTDGWIDAIIAGCKTASIKPDFISYQAVSTDIASIVASVAAMRTKLDAAGLSDVELILTEWRHIPGENGIYQNLDAVSMQAACFGTDGVMTTSSALKNLSVMAGLQYAGGLSRAYFKMSMLRSPWSWANWSSNNSRSYNKSYYALKLFNEIINGGYTKLVSVQNEGSRTLLAAKNDAGTKGCVLLVDAAAASSGTYVLPMSGLKNVAKEGDILALTASKNAATASEVINVSDDKIQFFNYAGNCAYLVRFTMGAAPSPTDDTFYGKLANDTRAVDSSDFATGGDYIFKVSDTEYVHVFKDGGTFTPNQDLVNVQILAIGGGGAGGSNCGGGGGAGGFVYTDTASVAANTAYTVTVGAGGAIAAEGNHGGNGADSSFASLVIAKGGGGGACYTSVKGRNVGWDGGSGGGGAYGTGEAKVNAPGGAGTDGQGNAGGNANSVGGGGGGAGAAGATPTGSTKGGAGGAGLSNEILGYAQVFAGGGAGGAGEAATALAEGGIGGGGNSAKDGGPDATPGEDGLGGGGGAGATWTDGISTRLGAAGGSGIVIVRYRAVPVHQHVWGEWFEEGGVEKRVCQYEGCDAFETREIPAPTLTDYYKVGADPDDAVGHNSWVKSCSSTVGWALTQGGSVIANHQVSASGRYIVPDGAVLRSPSNKDGTSGDPYVQQPFGGAELVLRTGGNLYLQSTGSGTTSEEQKSDLKGANLVKVPNLIAEGGTILHATASYRKRLEGAIEVRSAGLVVKQNNSGSNQERSLTIASTITGSGPIILASATVDSAAQYLRFTGDMSGFTGTFQIDSATAGHLKNEDFRITGAFGGTITALPEGFTSVEINYDGLDAEKGLRVASTTIPTALKTKLTLFGATDFTAENLPLMTFPAGTTVNPAAFTVKYASTVDGTGVAFENLGTVENADGTITLVANFDDPSVNVWLTLPSITKSTWVIGDEPGKVTAPTAKRGTPTAKLNDADWDGSTMPDAVGEYTIVWTVPAGSAGGHDYAAITTSLDFSIIAEPSYTTYYKVGSDSGSSSSFAKSESATLGWSLTQGGTIDTTHVVSSIGDYIVPSDTVLRTQSLDADDTFAGRSLTLAGGSLTLKRKGYETQANKTVTVSQLVLTDGGAIKHASDKTDFTLDGTSVTIPDGKTGAIEISGGNRRGIIVKSAICGAGTLQLTWQGSGSAPSSQDDYLKLTGDNSLFTGTLTAVGDASVASTKYTLVLDGKFGGTITSLPKAKTNSIKVNYGNNPGLTVATTTIPAALKKDLLFYGSTDFAATPSLPLMTFPAGTAVDPADFTIKYANGEAAPTTTAFTGLGTIENADGTITLAANCGKPPAGTTFYQKLENDTRKVNSSDYATGGDYIYQVGGKEYIHVFKTTGSATFTPKQDLADVQVLVVGGGGSGGFSAGGGGGAGGLIYKTDLSLFANTGYAVTVGAGGAGTTLKSNVEASQTYCTGNSGQNSVFDTLTAVGGGAGGAGQTVSQNGANGGSGGGATGSGTPGAGTANQGFVGGAGATGTEARYTSGGGGGGAGATGANAGERGTSYAFAGNGGDGREIGTAILGYAQYFAGGGGGGTTGSSEDRRAAGGLGGGGAGAVDDGDATTHVDAKAGENGLGGGGGGGAIWWSKTCQSRYNGAAGGNGIVIVRYSIVEDPNRNKWVTPPSITKTSWLEGWESGIVTAPTAKFGEPIATLNDVIWDGEMPTEAGTYTITWTAPKYQEGGDDQITTSLDFEILAFTPPTGNTFYDRIKNDMRNLSDASACIGATGGDYIYEDDGYYIHIFKNSGSFTPKKNLSEVQLLLVGGGGTGGGDCGGGGGAGGVVYATDITLSEGVAYTATVGAGGKITSLMQQYSGSSTTFKAGSTAVPGVDEAKGGGCGGLWDTGTKKNGANGGSGGGACGAGAVGAGTSGQGHNGGLGASSDVGGGGGGAGAAGAAASGASGTGKGGAGGAGYDYGIAMLGYEQYFGGGGGGGTCSKTEADRGAGGLGGGGAGAYFKNGSGQSTNGIAGNGEDGLGGGGGGASGGGGTAYAGSGGKGVVIIRYPIPYDVLNTEITGTIAMPDWKEDETPSEPDLTGLTVTPDMAAQALLVKYYADADCTQALDAKPILVGTYYVRAEIEKTRWYTAAVSEKTAFTIKTGEKTVVPIPTVSSFVYDGTPKTCVEAGDGYTIDSASTVTATDAGNYSVTLKLNDPETSQWSDLTSADKVVPWSIAQAENEWTTEAAIDKTEWMKTLDEPGKLTAPVAKFGPIVATLNGQDWNGVLPTEVGSYTAKWTVEGTENYTGLEVTISFKVKPDFYTNSWKTEPTISKTSWKSTEEPATITPDEASYGNDTMSAKISVDNGQFVDWDGMVPTTKGAYKIQWVVEETESYSRLEKTIEFLIDRRYCPTHPFMYQKEGDTTWKGADTFAAALNGITDGTGTIELCQDITDATVDKIGTLNYKTITLRSNLDDDQIYVWTRLGKSYNGFQVQNSSKLTLADIVLNITANGSDKMINLFELGASANENGGEVTLGAGAVVQGEVSGSLYTTEKGSSFVLNGGTIRNLTAGSSLLPMPRKSFSVKSGTIENCTVNGAIIPLGDKTNSLSNVTITNNTTTAGAITVGANGVLKVSGDVIVKDNKVGDDEKNIVLQNAENLQMTGAFGATASVGVSFGEKGDVFGAFTSETADDKKSAAKFFNDADSTKKLVGHVNGADLLQWWINSGLILVFGSAQ